MCAYISQLLRNGFIKLCNLLTTGTERVL